MNLFTIFRFLNPYPANPLFMSLHFRAISVLLACFAFISCDRQKPSIAIGTIQTIHSDILDEDRKVWVHVPDENPPDSVKYPVLYLLDGDAHFKSVVGLMHQMSSVNGNNICPKMIIVGIPNTQRMRDLTPTKAEEKKADASTPRSGGGEAFTDFIAKELIPSSSRTTLPPTSVHSSDTPSVD